MNLSQTIISEITGGTYSSSVMFFHRSPIFEIHLWPFPGWPVKPANYPFGGLGGPSLSWVLHRHEWWGWSVNQRAMTWGGLGIYLPSIMSLFSRAGREVLEGRGVFRYTFPQINSFTSKRTQIIFPWRVRLFIYGPFTGKLFPESVQCLLISECADHYGRLCSYRARREALHFLRTSYVVMIWNLLSQLEHLLWNISVLHF